MSEHPILFSPAMMRAILDGRKSQTRRLTKPRDDWRCAPEPQVQHEVRPGLLDNGEWGWLFDGCTYGIIGKCPYGQPGDVLWVRETHWRWGSWVKRQARKNEPDKWRFVPGDEVAHPPLFEEPALKPPDRTHLGYHKRPSIFMPRFACRLLLKVEAVRVERLQEISEEDAVCEGMRPTPADCGLCTKGICSAHQPALGQFAAAWGKVNCKRAPRSSNPWVFVVEFSRMEGKA